MPDTSNSSHSYDYDYLVIGAGSGGVRSSRIAASHGAKVALIEKQHIELRNKRLIEYFTTHDILCLHMGLMGS